MKSGRKLWSKLAMFFVIAVLVTISTVSFLPAYADNGNAKLQIVSVNTDKASYYKGDTITYTIQIKNTGTAAAAGFWTDIWVDKMPISTLDIDPKYHDKVYNDLTVGRAGDGSDCFGTVTAYMPDPNPVYNPVPNKFVSTPIAAGETQTVTLTMPASGVATTTQTYSAKVYQWDPAKGQNYFALKIDPATQATDPIYGADSIAKGSYRQVGYSTTAALPNNKAAALILRVDDVQAGDNNVEAVHNLLAIMDKHNAKGTWMIQNGGSAACKTDLSKALTNGHEIGLHGTDHYCGFDDMNGVNLDGTAQHIPEAYSRGLRHQGYWHEFEGPHFVSFGYDYEYNRLKTMFDEITATFGVKPVSFTAPQVALSASTIAACTNLGIKYSSNFVGDKPGYAYHDVVEVPFNGDYSWGVSNTLATNSDGSPMYTQEEREICYNGALEAAKKDLDNVIAKQGEMTLVFHTFKMNDPTYKWLEEFLTYADSKNVWYTTISQYGEWFANAPKTLDK